MLRINEIYHSFQGEGPNTGSPTLFVRFVGCNLKCPGWPCDSQHAIDPKLYRKDMIETTPDGLTRMVLEEWRKGERICFTGGEVFLQRSDDLERALRTIKHHTGAGFEVFTNGTLRWPDNIHSFFNNIIMDWKLPGAGELVAVDGGPKVVWENLDQLTTDDAIKFTIKNRGDFEEARDRWEYFCASRGLQDEFERPQVWAGPVWGSVAAEMVAQWIMDDGLPWHLNVQVHKFVWDPDKRGI